MLTFKEFLALEAAAPVNPLTQAGGNYGTGVNNPYWSHGGRYSRTTTTDFNRPDQLLYHIARLLDDVERMVHYRQNLPANAPISLKNLGPEFSQQNLDILTQLGVMRPCTAQELIQSGQQVDPNDPQTQSGYVVDEHKIKELQQQMIAAQKDDQARNWMYSHLGPLVDKFTQKIFTPTLQIHPSMRPL